MAAKKSTSRKSITNIPLVGFITYFTAIVISGILPESMSLSEFHSSFLWFLQPLIILAPSLILGYAFTSASKNTAVKVIGTIVVMLPIAFVGLILSVMLQYLIQAF